MENIFKKANKIDAKVKQIENDHKDKTKGQIRLIAIRELSLK